MNNPRENSSAYRIKVVRRAFDQTADDWHATVTRRSDGEQLMVIAAWRWLLSWRLRRVALDRAFRYGDKLRRKRATVEEITR